MLLRQSISLFIVTMIMLPVTIMAQSPQYRVETFGTRDGLLSSKIYTLAQTNDRLLWIGTELGISTYNGYNFTNYQYSSANEAIGRILCITQDSLQGVWIGGDKGLFFCQDGDIRKISIHSRPSIAIEALLTDSDGNIWAGDINALYKIDVAQVNKVQKDSTRILKVFPYASFTKRVFALATDTRKNIYVGSFDGVFKLPYAANTYEWIWENPDVYNNVRSIAATSPDSIFWNFLDGPIMKMINGKVSAYRNVDYLGWTVFNHRGEMFALTSDNVAALRKDDINPLVSLTSITNHAHTALIDKEGNIWTGTWEGLQKFRKTVFNLYSLQHLPHPEIFSMLERRNNDLVFGGNRGMLLTKKENKITSYNTPPLFHLAEVMCMYEDAGNVLWAGSGYQGVARLMGNRVTRWEDTGFLKDNNCEALYQRSDGKLLACTEHGVTLIDPLATDPLVAHYDFQKKYTRYPELFGCFQTGNSGYWFYGSQGLYALKNNELIDDSIRQMPVKNLYINRIVADKKGNIWVATHGKGLLRCKLSNGQLVLQQQYDTKKGVPSDNALSVLVDKNDNVWWADYMSLSVLLHPGWHEQLISFNEKDGLISSYYQTLKLEQQRDGTIWGLTTMGIFSFHPDSIGRNNLAPALLMDNVSVAGSSDNYANAAGHQLSYHNNSIRFQYTAVCLTDPSKVRYAYRIRELDSNWTYSSNRNANFNFLRPGSYTFELMACNNNNIWTPVPLRYSFTIHPPFWQTWWFRLLVLALICAIILILFRRRIAAFKTRAAIKQQMAELEAKAIRAQMNPHFIFNSLNAIQESIVLNDFDTSYQYLSKFSKLLRLVLNNSEKNFIPLQSEIEMNRLYLELESLRFKHSFSYSIEADEAIDTDMIQFPSLMLQPFIENAVWHGLMHRDGEKKLWIRFSKQDGQLNCEIEDNGIGREKADQIKKQKLGSHHFESKGTNLARQRIQLLQESGAMKATLSIDDMKDDKGEATGTKVTISIPLIGTK
jgi:ligand-binding sensor domain-containing protein